VDAVYLLVAVAFFGVCALYVARVEPERDE